jgi:hypothetical protein
MDMYNPQNPGQINNAGLVDLTLGGILPEVNPIITNVNGTTIAPTFLSPYPLPGANGTNFGQGVILRVKYLTVYIQAPVEMVRSFPDLNNCQTQLLVSRCQQNAINGVNSNNDLILYKCKGKINDCDDCEAFIVKCDCLFPDQTTGLCCHIKQKKHKCQCYRPHTKSNITCPGRCNFPRMRSC